MTSTIVAKRNPASFRKGDLVKYTDPLNNKTTHAKVFAVTWHVGSRAWRYTCTVEGTNGLMRVFWDHELTRGSHA